MRAAIDDRRIGKLPSSGTLPLTILVRACGACAPLRRIAFVVRKFFSCPMASFSILSHRDAFARINQAR